MLAFAITFTRAWAATYTRGLPAGLRAERREEIDCDLWEHQRLSDLERSPATGTAFQILLRLILGVPADVAWRMETGASARTRRGNQVNESILMKGLLAIAVLIALFPTAFGITLLMGQGDPGSATERIAAGTILMLVGLLLVAGLVISRSRPRLGLGLVTAPVIFTCAWLYWVAVIIAPIGLCLAAFAYFRGRQSGGTNMNGGAPAATA